MKYFLSFIFLFLPLMVNAESVKIDGIWYNLNAKAKIAEVTHGDWEISFSLKDDGRYFGDITIPETVVYEGIEYDVTTIGEHAFKECNNLCSIKIPKSVTTIAEGAFAYCRKLTSVVIPNTVLSIKGTAFFGCTSLSSIIVPEGLTEICYGVFQDCGKLTSLTIPSNVKVLDNWAFKGCTSLTTVTIPDNVITIGGAVFEGCNSLVSITLGKRVNRIFSVAFGNCPNLEKVICFAEKVPTINNNAFEGSYIEHSTLYVPSKSISSYKSDDVWGQFKEILPLTDTSIKKRIVEKEVETIFTVDGNRYNQIQKGLNIILTKDGKAKKIYVK